VPEGLDERKGLEGAADVDGRPLAFQILAVLLELGKQLGQFLAHELLGTFDDARIKVLEMVGHGVEGIGHVLDAEVGHAQERNTELFLHHFGQFHGGPGTLDHVEPGPVAAADIGHPTVTRDVGHHLDTHLLEVFPDDPDFAGEIEVTEDIDGNGAHIGHVAGAGQGEHGLAGRGVALALVALEPFRLDRDDRNAGLGRDVTANRVHVVADDAHDAGGIYESRIGLVTGDKFEQGGLELFFAAEDDILFLQISGETEAMQLGARGKGAPDVPGINGAANGTVHEVQGVGDGIEHHPRAAEHTGPLGNGPGQALPVAGQLEGPFALAVDLIPSFFENGLFHVGSFARSPCAGCFETLQGSCHLLIY